MEKEPRTYKAKVEWLQAKLDQVQVEKMQDEQKIKRLYELIDRLRGELADATDDARHYKRKYAEADAWANIHHIESEATLKALHEVYTKWAMEIRG